MRFKTLNELIHEREVVDAKIRTIRVTQARKFVAAADTSGGKHPRILEIAAQLKKIEQILAKV